jgi:hypothetical protein
MKANVKVGQYSKNWDSIDQEAERHGASIRSANAARATLMGKGKRLGHHMSRV